MRTQHVYVPADRLLCTKRHLEKDVLCRLINAGASLASTTVGNPVYVTTTNHVILCKIALTISVIFQMEYIGRIGRGEPKMIESTLLCRTKLTMNVQMFGSVTISMRE